MKKILFLTHYFPPEVNAPANRTYEHCRQWASSSDVTVITNNPNHPDGKLYPGYKNRLYSVEFIDNIKVIRIWTFVTPNEGFILRTLNYFIYMLLSIFVVLIKNVRFDILIATTPQFFCGVAGMLISGLRKKKFVLEVRDLWPESIVAVGSIRNRNLINLLEKIERKLYSSADLIITVTESFKISIIEKGFSPNKIEIIYNGADPSFEFDIQEILDYELREFLQSGFIVGYIGTLGMAHGLQTIIEAAELISDHEVKFVIIGSGAEKNDLEVLLNSKKLNNIRIFPLRPRKEIPSIINQLDIFLVHLRKNDLFKTVIPSKIFEGMMFKKPILLGVDGEVRSIIEQNRCGVFFEPGNSHELVNQINFLKSDRQYRDYLGKNGYDTLLNKFNRVELGKRMLALMESL